ncbi:flagellar hook-basal body complex protein [Anaerovorax odorimutans]|uniref:flagellar hook-basal body complex protein n=1 Tax=Anaerovorax odorimutans TaxID=109327 RepID=UPI0004093778|nr:flagellar hook-basal body complex protein [Anaerovorax odorimutans]
MVKSMFAAVAGLRAHQTKMDVIGNNIANVNTYGFKAGRATFKDVFYQNLTSSSAPGDVYGGGNPSQIGYGSQIGSVDVMHTSGGIAPTDNPMDAMIIGNGYFMVGPKKNSDATDVELDPAKSDDLKKAKLTRVGIFNFDGNGNLVDANRNCVYGFKYDGTGKVDKSKLVPIQKPLDSNSKPIKLTGISIGPDGTVSGIDADNKPVLIGNIAIANVPNPNALMSTENSYYQAKDNTGDLTAEVPGEGATGQLKTGCLEMANVDLSKEFTDMITTQRGFQANTRIITVTDEMLQELVNLKR